MTNSPPLQCKRCADIVEYAFWGQKYCFPCHRVMIAAEDAAIARETRKAQGSIDIALYVDRKGRAGWDIQIIDERGDLVWARDLADRYRKELNARQHRDYRER